MKTLYKLYEEYRDMPNDPWISICYAISIFSTNYPSKMSDGQLEDFYMEIDEFIDKINGIPAYAYDVPQMVFEAINSGDEDNLVFIQTRKLLGSVLTYLSGVLGSEEGATVAVAIFSSKRFLNFMLSSVFVSANTSGIRHMILEYVHHFYKCGMINVLKNIKEVTDASIYAQADLYSPLYKVLNGASPDEAMYK